MIDEEYFRRYLELREMIESGYVDYFILESIEGYNQLVQESQKALPKDSLNVIGHIIEVIKDDLGLTIWKLTENSSDANRIGTLEKYLKEKYQNFSSISYSPKTKNLLTKSLSEIRKHSLAHNSLQKGNTSISITSLKESLDEIKGKFNSSCKMQYDSRVSPIEDSEIFSLQFHVSMGFRWMIENSVVQIQQKARGIDNAQI